jgi:hypothetical protein
MSCSYNTEIFGEEQRKALFGRAFFQIEIQPDKETRLNETEQFDAPIGGFAS